MTRQCKQKRSNHREFHRANSIWCPEEDSNQHALRVRVTVSENTFCWRFSGSVLKQVILIGPQLASTRDLTGPTPTQREYRL